MATSIDTRIQQAAERLKQLKALRQQQAARAKALAGKKARQADVRRKILLGAFVLDASGLSPAEAADFTIRGRRFVDWLQRPDERALFALPPLPNPNPGDGSPS